METRSSRIILGGSPAVQQQQLCDKIQDYPQGWDGEEIVLSLI